MEIFNNLTNQSNSKEYQDPDMELASDRASIEDSSVEIDSLVDGLVELDAFQDPRSLKIPDVVKNRFKSQGVALRWIRVSVKGRDDVENITRRRKEGWTFVKKSEVPELNFVVDGPSTTDDMVVVGDVALAKNLISNVEKRNAYYQKTTDAAQNAVNQYIQGKNFINEGSKIEQSNTIFD